MLFLVAAVLRMGWISQFLSKAVITGFLFGAAIDVVVGELPKLTGTDADGDNTLAGVRRVGRTVDDVHGATLVVGIIALAVVLALHVLAPKVPGRAGAGGRGAGRVEAVRPRRRAASPRSGDVPAGLPVPALPSAELVQDHLATIATAAVALFLIGFSQTAGDARMFAARHRYRIRVDQEMVAQGMANVGAGRVPGHAGVDEPVGQLAERLVRGPHADGVGRHRRRWWC